MHGGAGAGAHRFRITVPEQPLVWDFRQLCNQGENLVALGINPRFVDFPVNSC
jgi:hypothetical protein